MVEWSISLQPQEELAAFARFGNAVASLCVEKKGARACLKNHFRNQEESTDCIVMHRRQRYERGKEIFLGFPLQSMKKKQRI